MEAVKNIASCIAAKFHNPLLMIHLLYCLTPMGWKYYYNIHRLHSFTRKVISDKKSKLQKFNDNNDDTIKRTKFLDFIDILLSARVSLFTFSINSIRRIINVLISR